MTCWVMIWFWRFCLKSSNEMPWLRWRFLQLFHAVEVHLLAHLVEPLDEFGIGGDAQVFALFEQQLLVDQVAEDVLCRSAMILSALAGSCCCVSCFSAPFLRWYSVRVMIWLLTRAMISSITVSAGKRGGRAATQASKQPGE